MQARFRTFPIRLLVVLVMLVAAAGCNKFKDIAVTSFQSKLPEILSVSAPAT